MSTATPTPVAQGDTPDVPRLQAYVVELLRDGQHSRFSKGVHDRSNADLYVAKFNEIAEGTPSEARVWAADVRLLGPADADDQPDRFDVELDRPHLRGPDRYETIEVLLTYDEAVAFVRGYNRNPGRGGVRAVIRPTQHLAKGGAA